MKICARPFKSITIDLCGDVYTCCPSYQRFITDGNKWSIGNIFCHTFEEIWYSEKAQQIRQMMWNNDFSCCDLSLCRQALIEETNSFDSSLMPECPVQVTLAYDKECNLSCIMCRDEKHKNSKETVKNLDDLIEKTLLPVMKNAKQIALMGSGEVFYSSHGRKLVKKITRTYPDVKFLIMTNGILCNEVNCNELGLTNKIEELFVSLHAITPEVYSKIMVGSNIETVKKNIRWMANEEKKGNIGMVSLSCVISDLNYKEIPLLVDFAKDLNITISLTQYFAFGAKIDKEYDLYAVWNKEHKNHGEFVSYLKKYTDYEKCRLQPLFQELKDK